jgi:hypothetical protein
VFLGGLYEKSLDFPDNFIRWVKKFLFPRDWKGCNRWTGVVVVVDGNVKNLMLF